MKDITRVSGQIYGQIILPIEQQVSEYASGQVWWDVRDKTDERVNEGVLYQIYVPILEKLNP